MRIYLIHGFLESPKMWDFTSSINGDFAFLSLPGHGDLINTPCPDKMENIGQMIMNQIDTSVPYAIIGHSMGGYLLGTLVHLGAQPQWLGLFHSKLGCDDDAKKMQRSRAIDLVEENKNLYIRTMISNLFPEAFKVKKYNIIDMLVQDAFEISSDTIQNCQRAMMGRSNFIEEVKSLNIPIHFFGGSEDLSVALSDVQNEDALLTNSTLTIAEEVGHMGQWECPDLAWQWINSMI